MDYKHVRQEDAPIEVKKWLEENKVIEGDKTFTIKDMNYVVITRGEKKTGGYGIEIDCKENEKLIEILVKFIDPNKDQIMIQVITHPLEIIKFKKVKKEIIITYEK